MRVCGVDIKSGDAILAVCDPSVGAAVPLELKTKRLKLADGNSSSDLRSMLRSIEAFLHENKVEVVMVKERQSKGSMSASGITFKIEALFQLAHSNVSFVHGKTLEKFSKSNVAGVPASLSAFQKDAFLAAAWRLNEEKLL